MKLFRFDQAVGHTIPAFGSQNLVMSQILQISQAAHIGCMYIGPNGTVGFHQATSSQLFLVVQGEGWVMGMVWPESQSLFRLVKPHSGKTANGMNLEADWE